MSSATLASVTAARISIRATENGLCVYQGRRRMSDAFDKLTDAIAWLDEMLAEQEWED